MLTNSIWMGTYHIQSIGANLCSLRIFISFEKQNNKLFQRKYFLHPQSNRTHADGFSHESNAILDLHEVFSTTMVVMICDMSI